MTLTLYYFPNTAARAVHIALEEAGAQFEPVLVDFRTNAQRSPEHLARHPSGRVPALGTPQGVLFETPAILGYLAAIFPGAGLLPADPFRAAQAMAVSCWLASTMHVAHAHGRRAARWADDPAAQEAMRAKMPANMADCATQVQGMMQGRWVLGEEWSVADAHLFTVAGWLEADGLDIADWPRLAAHRALMLERPAVQRALAREEAALAA
ncbi:MAG: glutathione S-transferase family protein [Alphaproteobacteria bacterium]|nr:MAG: glutathione S-transferase family protein [Alphaproteobacteria bacterium]